MTVLVLNKLIVTGRRGRRLKLQESALVILSYARTLLTQKIADLLINGLLSQRVLASPLLSPDVRTVNTLCKLPVRSLKMLALINAFDVDHGRGLRVTLTQRLVGSVALRRGVVFPVDRARANSLDRIRVADRVDVHPA